MAESDSNSTETASTPFSATKLEKLKRKAFASKQLGRSSKAISFDGGEQQAPGPTVAGGKDGPPPLPPVSDLPSVEDSLLPGAGTTAVEPTAAPSATQNAAREPLDSNSAQTRMGYSGLSGSAIGLSTFMASLGASASANPPAKDMSETLATATVSEMPGNKHEVQNIPGSFTDPNVSSSNEEVGVQEQAVAKSTSISLDSPFGALDARQVLHDLTKPHQIVEVLLSDSRSIVNDQRRITNNVTTYNHTHHGSTVQSLKDSITPGRVLYLLVVLAVLYLGWNVKSMVDKGASLVVSTWWAVLAPATWFSSTSKPFTTPIGPATTHANHTARTQPLPILVLEPVGFGLLLRTGNRHIAETITSACALAAAEDELAQLPEYRALVSAWSSVSEFEFGESVESAGEAVKFNAKFVERFEQGVLAEEAALMRVLNDIRLVPAEGPMVQIWAGGDSRAGRHHIDTVRHMPHPPGTGYTWRSMFGAGKRACKRSHSLVLDRLSRLEATVSAAHQFRLKMSKELKIFESQNVNIKDIATSICELNKVLKRHFVWVNGYANGYVNGPEKQHPHPYQKDAPDPASPQRDDHGATDVQVAFRKLVAGHIGFVSKTQEISKSQCIVAGEAAGQVQMVKASLDEDVKWLQKMELKLQLVGAGIEGRLEMATEVEGFVGVMEAEEAVRSAAEEVLEWIRSAARMNKKGRS